MNPARIRAIYSRLRQANPEPKTELNYSTPFELLVAVMLSAHTTDKSVNTATRTLFPLANTPQAILALGEEGVKPYIKPAGMYNQKAKNLIELLNIVFGHTTIAVDTHIFRVSNRTGLAPGKDPLAVETELNEITPDEFKLNAHHWLLLHGRYVCIARLPACPKCIIRDLCEYEPKTPPEDLKKSEAPVARNAVRAAKDAAKAKARGAKRGTARGSGLDGAVARGAAARNTAARSTAGAKSVKGGKPAGKAAKQSARAKSAKATARKRAH
jgi:endonuclease III